MSGSPLGMVLMYLCYALWVSRVTSVAGDIGRLIATSSRRRQFKHGYSQRLKDSADTRSAQSKASTGECRRTEMSLMS